MDRDDFICFHFAYNDTHFDLSKMPDSLDIEDIIVKKDLFEKLSKEAKEIVLVIISDTEGVSRIAIGDIGYQRYVNKRLNGLRYRLMRGNFPKNMENTTWYKVWCSLSSLRRKRIIKEWEARGIKVPDELKLVKACPDTKVKVVVSCKNVCSILKRHFKKLFRLSEREVNIIFREIRSFVNDYY